MVVASVLEMQLRVTVRLCAADRSVKTLVSPDIASKTGSRVGENGWLVAAYNGITVDISKYVDDIGVVTIVFEGETYSIPTSNGAGCVDLPDGRRMEVQIED